MSNNQIGILQELLKLPYIKQRTPEWFKLRENRLTASDLYDAIKNPLSLAKRKLKSTTFNSSAILALKWGTMFEAMATRIYSNLKNKKIHEFGLIINENIDNFGASPDGITELGIMIEIKCPISRKIIDGEIPEKYYMQIQGQLAVCNLEECDYIECGFKIFDSKEEYLEDNQEQEFEKINHGIIAEFKDADNNFEYEYSDAYLTKEEAISNIELKVQKANPNLKFSKYNYWKLLQINIQKVYFNEKNWKENIVPKINDFWTKVESHRKQGPFIEDSD
jgi:hypothetical protein